MDASHCGVRTYESPVCTSRSRECSPSVLTVAATSAVCHPVVSLVANLKLCEQPETGAAVATAARMESSGEAGAVHVSETTYGLLPEGEQQSGEWVPRPGGVQVRARGGNQRSLLGCRAWRHGCRGRRVPAGQLGTVCVCVSACVCMCVCVCMCQPRTYCCLSESVHACVRWCSPQVRDTPLQSFLWRPLRRA